MDLITKQFLIVLTFSFCWLIFGETAEYLSEYSSVYKYTNSYLFMSSGKFVKYMTKIIGGYNAIFNLIKLLEVLYNVWFDPWVVKNKQ